MAEQRTSEQEPASRPLLLIAGLGASAGGLEAFGRFFSAMPAESGTALVVVQHLDPHSQGLLTELLAKQTTMPVLEIQDGMRVEADHVYVAPPQVSVRIDQRILHLALLTKADRRQTPVDSFFSSLAEDQRAAAVGIILSGEGTDGTLGLKAISDAGGITMVQDSASAKYDSMPRNAAVTGIADHVLPPEKIPEELLAYARHFHVLSAENRLAIQRQQIAEAIPAIAGLLHEATRHDFQQYKTSTLVRRIERRMQVLRVAEVHRYVERLRQDRDEAGLLFKELLIGVTAFFRDADAYAMLAEQVVPRLVENRGPGEQVRIWVPGCATGEEAYSIAILVREAMERLASPPDVQIFATDIDERALRAARQGSYPLSIAENISPDRLARSFIRKGKRLHLAKELREMCLFSPHNLISDPPFSRLDLISCRNLLIYLGPPLQKKLMSVFHYALRPGGYLLLGPSENVAFRAELFREVDAKQRLFQRKPTAVQSADVLAASERSRGSFRPWEPGVRGEADVSVVAGAIVMEEYAPQYAVVNEEGQVVALSNDTSKYLQLAGGPFHNNIVRMARTGLRGGLRAALGEAAQTRRKALRENLFVRTDSGRQTVSISAEPMPPVGDEAGLLLVIFRDVPSATALGEVVIHPASEEVDSLIAQLEHELSTARDELERSIQDLEAANEELKSSNEELLSMNEELQSANEELETSKEEIQAGSESLARAHSDLENLFNSTQIATIFLDDALTIRSFTPAVARIYNVIASDVGRPIGDFTHRAMEMPPLPDPRTLRDTVEPVVDEIRGGDGQYYLRRVLPYRNHGGQAAGMVVTFVDITERRRVEAALQESEFRLRAALTAGAMGAWDWDIPRGRTVWSKGHYTILGYQVGEIEPSYQAWAARVHPEDLTDAAEAMCRAAEQSTEYYHEYRVRWPDGSVHWVEGRRQQLYDERGQAIRMYGLIADTTERKRAETTLQTTLQRFYNVLSSMYSGILLVTDEGQVEFANRAFCDLFCLEDAPTDLVGLSAHDTIDKIKNAYLYPNETLARIREILDRGQPVKGEELAMHGGRTFLRDFVPLTVHGKSYGRLWIHFDITERKQAEEILLQKEAALREAQRVAHVGSWYWDAKTDVTTGSDELLRIYGLDPTTQHMPTFSEQRGRCYPVEEWERLNDAVQRTTQTGVGYELDVQAIRDGTPIWITTRSEVVRDTNGQTLGLRGTVQDITEHRQAEEALREQAALLDLAHDSIVVLDTSDQVVFWNRGAEETYGWTPDEAMGQVAHDLLKTRFPKPLAEIAEEVREKGRWEGELPHTRKDGQMIVVASRWAAQRDESGRQVGVLEINRDITKRKRAEEQLRELSQRLTYHVDNSPLAVIEWGPGMHLTRWSHEAERLFGWRADEVLGKQMEDFRWIYEEDQAQVAETTADLQTGANPHRFSANRNYRKDGSIVECEWYNSSLVDAAGKLRSILSLVLDVTARNQAQRALAAAKLSAEHARAEAERAADLAEQASKAKSHFLAVLSHELRTPLNPVVVTAAMLQQDPHLDGATREHLEVIRRNAELEARLIDDLLDVTRIERGKVELHKRPIELCTIIKHAVEVCLPDIEVRKLEFGVDLGPDAPYNLEADPARLQQVLWNLLKNAVKFTPVGGCVGIRCRRDGTGFVVMEVNDSGIGIEPADLSNIFNAFEQAERSSTRQFGGLGLGLTISKAMVELHGGTIEAHSPGKRQGATFRVRLPLLTERPQFVAPEARPRAAAAKQPARPLRILLVEDHGDTARIMKLLLKREGHEVVTAADLATALKLAGEQAFDLLVSDLGLPDGSGLELMHTLRAQGSTLVGIALSGFGQQKDIEQSRDAGFAAHLTKPADYDQLVDAIRRLTS